MKHIWFYVSLKKANLTKIISANVETYFDTEDKTSKQL